MIQADASSGAIQSTVFSTEGLPPRDRFDAWQSVFGGVNDIDAPAASQAAFNGRSEHWRIGPFLIGVSHNPERRIRRDRDRIRRDDLDHWAIRLSRTATCGYHIKGRSFVCRPGAAAITSLAEGYVEDNTGGEAIGLIFPRDAYPQLSARLEALAPDALLHSAAAALFGDFLQSLCLGMRNTPADRTSALAEMTRAVLSGCLPGAEREAAHSEPVMRRAQVEWVIRRHIGSARLDVVRLSALTGVSRSALYRMFESSGGIAAYIRRLRLSLIDEDLVNPDLAHVSIAKLAERRGFHCAASFSRSFRQAYGRSPKEAREAGSLGVMHRASAPPRSARSRPKPSPLSPSLLHILP